MSRGFFMFWSALTYAAVNGVQWNQTLSKIEAQSARLSAPDWVAACDARISARTRSEGTRVAATG
jgi:hypothetical protein